MKTITVNDIIGLCSADRIEVCSCDGDTLAFIHLDMEYYNTEDNLKTFKKFLHKKIWYFHQTDSVLRLYLPEKSTRHSEYK